MNREIYGSNGKNLSWQQQEQGGQTEDSTGYNFRDTFLTAYQVHRRFGVPRQFVYEAIYVNQRLRSIQSGKRRYTTWPWIQEWLKNLGKGGPQ